MPLSYLRLRLRPSHSSTKLGRVIHSGRTIKEVISSISNTTEVSLDKMEIAVEVLDHPDELQAGEVLILYKLDSN